MAVKQGIASPPQEAAQSQGMIAVSPWLITPHVSGEFSLYLEQQGRLVLYAARGEQFTTSHRDRLVDMGLAQVFIPSKEREGYERYVEENLGHILGDDSVPVTERCRVWHDTSVALVREMFDFEQPGDEMRNRFNRVRQLIKSCMRTLARPDMLRELSKMVRHGFSSYHHGLGVLVYTATLMNTFSEADSRLTLSCCLGAMLHDIGKRKLPAGLLDSPPEHYTRPDMELYVTHPSLGVSICSNLGLSQETLMCLLFHHEREDGAGFPSGAFGNDIPFYPKVVALCNRFDNLTRTRHWRQGLTPFAALKAIRSDPGFTDADILRRFILVLSKAHLT